MHLYQVLHCPPGLGFSPPAIVPNNIRLGNHSLLCRATPPAKKSHRLRIVVSMLSQRVSLWPSRWWFRRSKLGKVFRSEGPRHTPVQQGLNRLGFQHSDFKAKAGGRPIIQLQDGPLVITPCFAAARPPQRRATVYELSFRCSRNVSSLWPSRWW